MDTLSQHQYHISTELSQLQTALNCIQSPLDNQTGHLNNKVDGLSSKLDTLSQQQHHISTELAHIQTSLLSTQSPLDNQTGKLNNKVDGLSSKLDTLNTTLSQHQHHTATDLAHLQTSLNSTQSSLKTKLDSLTATIAQLSSDHQQIQNNISDVECVNTIQSLELQQNLWNTLTHQLEKIQGDLSFIRGPYTCGGTGGWRRVVYLDMTGPSTTCPSGWKLTGYSKRTCGRVRTGLNTCDSATFSVSGGPYSRICGRIRAYQYGGTVAFYNYNRGIATRIDDDYVDGVSVTHGSPRNHIWTFAAGAAEGSPTRTFVCPCDASIDIRIPPFVGEDYFCESGVNEAWIRTRHFTFHSNDALWDGEDCLTSSTCCSRRNPPYFVKQLQTPTTEDIEARICLYYNLSDANIAVELVELYVQ